MQAAGIVGVQPSDLFTIEDLFELNNEIKVRFLLSARHSFRALQSAASERHARRHCEHRRCARPFASRLPTSAPGSDPRLLRLPWASNGLTLAAVIATATAMSAGIRGSLGAGRWRLA
jgi:hypothetical protein